MQQDPTDELLSVFERRRSINPMADLVDAIGRDSKSGQRKSQDFLSCSAIGIDTNILLRLATQKNYYNVVDYLRKVHKAPLIIPGQSIQEFWNNSISYMNEDTKKLWSKYSAFENEANNFEFDFGGHLKNIRDSLEEFKLELERVGDRSTIELAKKVLNDLQERGVVSFCPRSPFYEVVAHRDKTKTPPGFEDKGKDGDFFIWADFLYGLKKQQICGMKFDHVIFVTQDGKPDWSIAGSAHPILVSEVRALLNTSFEIWDFNELITETSSKAS